MAREKESSSCVEAKPLEFVSYGLFRRNLHATDLNYCLVARTTSRKSKPSGFVAYELIGRRTRDSLSTLVKKYFYFFFGDERRKEIWNLCATKVVRAWVERNWQISSSVPHQINEVKTTADFLLKFVARNVVFEFVGLMGYWNWKRPTRGISRPSTFNDDGRGNCFSRVSYLR